MGGEEGMWKKKEREGIGRRWEWGGGGVEEGRIDSGETSQRNAITNAAQRALFTAVLVKTGFCWLKPNPGRLCGGKSY